MESENKELLEQAPVAGEHEITSQELVTLDSGAGETQSDAQEVGTSVSPQVAEVNSESVHANESSDKDVQPPLSRASSALLQAILLASGEPVSFVKLQEIMRCSRPEVAAALDALRQHCLAESSGVEVVAVGERLQLRTKVAYAEPVRELLAVKPRKLSQAALETLSVVAYQQPIVKSEIDKIRGVDVAPTLKTLLERKIIKIIGYQASVGQPALYGTTDDFLRIFGLSSLSELPALRDLRALAAEPGEVGENSEGENSEREDVANESGETDGTPPSITDQPDTVVVSEAANNDDSSVSNIDQQLHNDQSEVGNA